MAAEFLTFRQFDDIALATDLTHFLTGHHIPFVIEEESRSTNPIYSSNPELSKGYRVKISSDDFEQVDKLLLEEESKEVDAIGADYYLFGFTIDELTDLLQKADEWSAFDVALARKILKDHGHEITDEALGKLKQQRLEELKVAETPQTFWITVGYMAAFLGGILGIFIGWHLLSHKKTLPDGEQVYDYSENDRAHGRRIFYLSIVIFAIAFIYRLLGFFGNYSFDFTVG